jgi:phenylacetate-coenzyme A ligase PaaK-like adenylate-forming protein
MIAATGGHFAGVVSWERLRRAYPWMRMVTRSFSVLAPLGELVDHLNDWRPTVLASYPTTLLLLAAEREAGRLRIAPRSLWTGGETLAQAERGEIERAFGCPVIDGYGASECMQIAFDCGHGWLHVNSDWVILEPIDSRGRPVAAGEASASVLLTNLANRVQPLIRYDLGDSVTCKATPCTCGSPFPAIRVDGRRDDIVVLRSAAGDRVPLLPLALATVVEEGARVHRFQVIQADAHTLRVRFEPPAGESRAAVWRRIATSLRAHLDRHGLPGITILQAAEPPQADPVSGKLREVLGLRSERRGHADHRGKTR